MYRKSLTTKRADNDLHSVCKSVSNFIHERNGGRPAHYKDVKLGDNTSADDSCIVVTYMSTGSVIHYRITAP